MLTVANLRKGKSQAIGTLILMIMASLFLNLGVVMFFDINSFFDERAEELNTAHFAFLQHEFAPSNAQLDFTLQFPNVTAVEMQDIIIALGGFVVDDDVSTVKDLIFVSGITDQQMNPPVLIGEYLPLVGDAIYLPHSAFLEGGYVLGEQITVEFAGEILDFTFAGSTEEILFGDLLLGSAWRAYVSESQFLQLQEQFLNNRMTMLSGRMKNAQDIVSFQTAYINEFLGTEYKDGFPATMSGLILSTYDEARSVRTFIPIIIASFIISFSVILLTVNTIVTRFRIVTSIEEGLINIGALKAIGYCNHQIISSIVVQYSIITLVGAMFGILLSQLALSLIGQLMEPMTGLLWHPTFDVRIMRDSLLFIWLIVVLFTFLSARRIKFLEPISALNGNITRSNLKKNSFTLAKPRGSLSMLLALKQLVGHKKQALMLSLIVASVTFASIAGQILHYNFNVNRNALELIVGGELPDAWLIINNVEEGSDFQMRMQARPEVKQIFGDDSIMLVVNEVVILTSIVEDFSYLVGNTLVEGRFPLYYNEIVLGTPALAEMDKQIGDLVTVRSGNNEREYLVTGIVQEFASGGLFGGMHFDGLAKIQPNFSFSIYSVFLEEGVDATAFTEQMMEIEGNLLSSAVAAQDQLEAGMSTMSGIFGIITALILLVVAAVIILVLYLMIKTTILRRKRELGIQKALGFTTFQLMNQIILSLMPTILFGVAIGATAGYFGFNPMIASLMRGMGIVQADLPTPLGLAFLICVALILISYIVSMLIAWRIRKISAYELVITR